MSGLSLVLVSVSGVLQALTKQSRLWASGGRKALEMAGIDKDDIGLIIVATTSSSHAFPSSACQVQRMLGIKDAASFDLAAACAGLPMR